MLKTRSYTTSEHISYSFIACEDGIDTLELQETHPDWFIVTGKKGAESWTLRPEVKAAIRAPIEAARCKWEEARDRFEVTETEEDRQAAVAAARELKTITDKLEEANCAIHAKYDRELPN